MAEPGRSKKYGKNPKSVRSNQPVDKRHSDWLRKGKVPNGFYKPKG
jgi:hypothetical protein